MKKEMLYKVSEMKKALTEGVSPDYFDDLEPIMPAAILCDLRMVNGEESRVKNLLEAKANPNIVLDVPGYDKITLIFLVRFVQFKWKFKFKFKYKYSGMSD